jgi:hypothetical protein
MYRVLAASTSGITTPARVGWRADWHVAGNESSTTSHRACWKKKG